MRLVTSPNFRDIGGVPTVDGGAMRRGMIFRSETVIEPTDADARFLRDTGITLVCDLRSAQERSHAPNEWWAAHGAALLELDILADIRGSPQAWAALREDPSVVGALKVMNTIYRELPIAAAPHLATIFARIADGQVPLLVHCTAGKDRTGFVCAMILAAVGATWEAIVADYLASVGRLNARVVDHTRRMILDRAGPEVSEPAILSLVGVEREYLESSFARIDVDYGSVDAYLEQAAGLTAARRDAVRARLLV